MSNVTNLVKPSTEIEVKIRDIKITVRYPKSGEMIDIAVLKAKLSDHQYSSLFLQTSFEAPLALRLIDAYSFFQIMVPDIKKNLTLDSFYELSVLDSLELIDVYENQILDWLNEWTETINKRVEELKSKSDKSKPLV